MDPYKSLLNEILEAGIAITGGDFGSIRGFDPRDQSFKVVAQIGFQKRFLVPFRSVRFKDLPGTPFARAFLERRRVIVPDIRKEKEFLRYLRGAGPIPFRAFQITPIYGTHRELLGMVSTYFRKPRIPDVKQLHILDLYVLQAARVLEGMPQKDPKPDPAPKKDPPAALPETPPRELSKIPLPVLNKAVHRLPFFSDLSSPVLQDLLRRSRFRQLPRGETLYRAGESLRHIFWVLAGALEEFRETPKGRKVTLGIRLVGDLLFDPDARERPRVHSQNVRALQTSILLEVPTEWVTAQVQNWDRLSDKFLAVLTHRIQQATIESEHQATFTKSQIVVCFLQHLCLGHRFDPRHFHLPYPKGLIASRLGMEPESLSRALPKLSRWGVQVKGNEVSLTRMESAQDYCCDSCSVAESCPARDYVRSAMGKGTGSPSP